MSREARAEADDERGARSRWLTFGLGLTVYGIVVLPGVVLFVGVASGSSRVHPLVESAGLLGGVGVVHAAFVLWARQYVPWVYTLHAAVARRVVGFTVRTVASALRQTLDTARTVAGALSELSDRRS